MVEHQVTGFNTGDILATAIMLGITGLIVVVVIVLLLKLIKNRGNSQLVMEQERSLQLQKQVEELNARVSKIEKLLREVE